MDHSATTNELIIAGIVGGIISLVFFPLISYLLVRWINWLLTSVQIEKPYNNTTNQYSTHPLRIRNRTFSTLKNVVAFITISFTRDDINTDPNIQTYTVDSSNEPLMLSWAKVVDNGNKPNMDINQGESADLNLFRQHLDHKPIPNYNTPLKSDQEVS